MNKFFAFLTIFFLPESTIGEVNILEKDNLITIISYRYHGFTSQQLFTQVTSNTWITLGSAGFRVFSCHWA